MIEDKGRQLAATAPGPDDSVADTAEALPRLLTADDLATELGRPKKHLYRWHAEHGLPAVKVGRSLLFERKAVLDWIVARTG